MKAKLSSTPSPLDERLDEQSMARLLRRVTASDRTAFVTLYEALSSQVRKQALAALSSGSAADAVVAATFLQIWWLAPLHSPDDADVPAWITAIAAGRIADRRRNSAPTPADADGQQRSPWSELSSAYDDTVAVVLAGLLGRRRLRKAF